MTDKEGRDSDVEVPFWSADLEEDVSDHTKEQSVFKQPYNLMCMSDSMQLQNKK
jgi:hypothetical protein